MSYILYLLVVFMILRIFLIKESFNIILFFNIIMTLLSGVILTLGDLKIYSFNIDIVFIYALVGFISTIGILRYHDHV